MPKSKVMELAIKIAGKVDKSLGTSVKTSSKQLNTIIQTANRLSNVTAAGLAAMGTGAAAATKYLVDLGGAWQKAENQVASSTGAMGADLDRLRSVMETVYANNFGEDVNDVAEAVALRMIGPAVNTVSKGMEAFGKAKTFFALLQASGKLGQFVTILKAAGTALAGPLGIILAIGAALVLLYRNWSQVDALVQSFIAMVGERFPAAGAFLQAFWQSIQAGAANAQAIIQNLLDFVGNVFAGNWEAAWQNVVNIFGNIFGMLGNLAKAPINGVIALVNKAIEGINGLAVDIPDWVPVVGGKQLGFSIPTIPQLAAGGIATRPTLAEIGEGGEPEAVMPLSKLAELLDRWPKPGPNGRGGAAGGDSITFAPVFNFYGGTPTREEAQEAGRISFAEFKRLYKQMKAEERRKNFRTDPV